jgi:hypothetical protein
MMIGIITLDEAGRVTWLNPYSVGMPRGTLRYGLKKYAAEDAL